MKYSLSWLVLLSLIPNNALAQIIPDSSLGTENSVVNSDGNRDTIDGGAIRNSNLFHSFQEFNVNTGREAYFTNPNGIDNIFSRVTGNNFSNIDGVLGVLGNANLFLINPNGILFGANAALDVNGSFFATTADSVVFGNGFEFSAANPNQPPLLTIDIPIGLTFRDNPQPIINLSVANDVGLQVNRGETLSLIGGDVFLGFPGLPLSGKITAPGSKIELGGLIATGVLTIEDDFRLSFPEEINRADVFLSAAEVNVASDGGGAITVNGSNIDLIEGSQLVGGIAEGLGNFNAQAGDITLNATGAVTLTDESSVQNRVNTNSIGNSGNINVNANSLTLISGGRFSTSTFGLGNGGNININVAEGVVLDGVTENSITRFASVLSPEARGNSGSININAGSLTLSNGALINTRVFASEEENIGGIGNSGDINIDVREAVTVTGFSQENFIFSSVISRIESGAEGNAGDISIKASSLFLTDGGFLSSSTFGQGSAGNIDIDVKEAITITNTGGIFSAIGEDAIVTEGERSNVTIKADSLLISDPTSQINTSTLGIADAGDINIEVNSLSLENGSFLVSNSFGSGNAGNISVVADETINFADNSRISSRVFFDASGQGGQVNLTAKSIALSETSFITTSTFSGNEQSNAGNINIMASSFSLEDGATLGSDSFGNGNAGNITVFADETISLVNNSSISSLVSEEASGQGGQINLTAKSVSLSETSFISTSTFSDNKKSNGGDIEVDVAESFNLIDGSFLNSLAEGKGKAGDITIDGEGATIILQGIGILGNSSSINNSSDATGNAGDIQITGRSLSLGDGGAIESNTLRQGLQGNITIDIEEAITLNDSARIANFVSNTAIVPEGENSTIQINAGSLFIAENSSISSFNSGIGNASDIVINVDEGFDVVSGFILSNLQTGGEGKAGDINIQAGYLSLKDGAFFDSSTSGQGDSGIVSITTDEAVTLSGAGTFIFNTVNTGAIGNSQGISIEAESLSITEGAGIQTLVRGASEDNPGGIGNAGNVDINVIDAVNLVDGSIRSSLGTDAEGSAGNIKIEARSLSLDEGARLNSSSFGIGDAGKITLDIQDTVNLSGFAFDNDDVEIFSTQISSFLGETATGKAGDISLKARSLFIDNGARLINSSFGIGDAGNITLDVQDAVNISGFSPSNNRKGILSSQITSALGEEAVGNAGEINLKARSLSLENGAVLSTISFGIGDAGDITLDIQDAINVSGFSPNSDGTDIFPSQINSAIGNDEMNGELEEIAIGRAGDITIKARSLFLTDSATLTSRNSGKGDAGNITIDIEDTVNLSGFALNKEETEISPTQLSSFSEIEGNAGGINLKARSLSIETGAIVSSFSAGKGNAGQITLDIEDTITISGLALNSDQTTSFPAVINSELAKEAEGRAGDIIIEARSLLLEDGGQINNTTFGIGDAGDIDINVDESVNLFGYSIINNSVGSGGVGNGGELNIQAKSLTLREGSEIGAVVFRAGFDTPGGTGTGGNITINATDFIDIAGISTTQLNIPDTSGDPNNTTGIIPTAGFSSGILAATQRGASGDAGTITITTDTLRLADGAVIDNSTTNNSNAGTIIINANILEALGGGQIITATRGNGNAADIKLNVTDSILISGSDPNFATRLERANEFGAIQGGDNIVTNQGAVSGIFANTSEDSTGDGGNIFIGIFKQEGDNLILDTNQFTPQISLIEGAAIFASTLGEGDAQNITLNTSQLTINQGASIAAFTENIGNAGNITVIAPQQVELIDSSSLIVETSSAGKPGNITITTPNLTIGKDAQISATATATSTNTEGGSSITINTSNLDLTGKLGIFAETQGIAPAGTLNLQPYLNQPNLDIEFTDTAIISASTSGSGTGGDINLTAPETINLSGQGTIAVATTGSGNAGSINLTAEQINISNQTQISASTSETGSAGSITLLGTESVFLDNSFITTIINTGAEVKETAATSNITITTSDLSLNNGTQITASTAGIGNAGNINLEATENLSLNNSTVSSTLEATGVGTAGNINLNAPLIVLTDGSIISTSTDGKGDGGTVRVIAEEDILFITSRATSAVGKQGMGDAGIVEVKAKEIVLQDAELSSSTAGEGNANSVIIEATENLSLNNTTVSSAVETGAIGNAGNVNLSAPLITLTDNSLISSSTEGAGKAGAVTLVAEELILQDGATISASNFPSIDNTEDSETEEEEESGNVTIEANNITLENGRINAETQAGDNGNITLNITEELILRDNSLISARALENATGGNVNLDARYIIAYPSQPQGNDIIASAKQGQGGEINITAQALFGIEEQKATTGNRSNDIDASSEFGLSGTVNIRQPDVNPASGLVDLTQEIVNASELIAQNVCTQTVNSEFVNVGKGGLPLNPEDMLIEENVEVGLVEPVSGDAGEAGGASGAGGATRKPPAQGWVFLEDGTVELVAYNPNDKGEQRSWDNHRGCQ